VPTYAPPRLGSEIVPQHVNDPANQAAKRILTMRMASDGKMLRLEDTEPRSFRELLVLGWRTFVGAAGITGFWSPEA
jgi:hypothetical protein